MGFPVLGYTGFALMSIVDFDAAADAWSALGVATLEAVPLVDLDFSSFFTGGGFVVESPEVVRWGIFRMSLYLNWLYANFVSFLLKHM